MLSWTAVLLAITAAAMAASPMKTVQLGDAKVLATRDDTYRLPDTIVPLHYDLQLHPNLEGDFRFNGTVAITLRADQPTVNITFHTSDIDVVEDSVLVTSISKADYALKVISQTWDEDRSFYTVTLDSPLTTKEEYKLKMDYFGYHSTTTRGFYRSSYLDRNKNTVWLATTHFEPIGARKAFPCFDEPALKATFKISIAAPKGLRAISNMPAANTEIDSVSGRTWYHFDETPMPMSTYLVAFVVSDFENTTNSHVSVWHEPGLQSQGLYAAELAPKVIQTLEDFTQVQYFLPKMDEVGVPDFTAGAMENWGIVTFRERMLLFEKGESSSTYKQTITTVISHEFSHQWFGDLVGPSWWSYIWLNEGFATYFEYFAAALVEPTWRLDEQFVVGEVHSALLADSSKSTHPMTFEHVTTPEQLSLIFDSISYNKAGSVIRMIDHVMTHDSFKKGLTLYLNKKGNSTAKDQDLIDSLVEQYKSDSDVDFQDFLVSWVRQAGHPVITVMRNYTDQTVTVSQERFLLSGNSTGDKQGWWVPITYATKSNPNFNITSPTSWLSRNDSEMLVKGLNVSNDEWIIFNVQQTGFYRVQYDAANWRLLILQLDSDQLAMIPAVNRAQILNDAFNLARAGSLKYHIVIQLLRYLSRETDYIPWQAALQGISYLNGKLKASPDYAVFKDFVLSLIKPAYEAVGFDEKSDDDHVTKLYRSLVLSWACDLGHTACVDTAVSKFKAFISNQEDNKVAPDLRKVVYCYGLQAGGYEDYDAMWKRYLNNTVFTEKDLLLNALGCTGNETASHEYLLKSLANDSGIKAQDISLVLTSTVRTETGVNFFISFIAKHYKDIILHYNSSNAVLSFAVQAAEYVTTQEQYNKLEKFLQSHQEELGFSGSTEAYLSDARLNLEQARSFGKEIVTEIKETYRLPTWLTPMSYRINLRPHITEGNFTFDGEVTARVRAVQYTDRVVLHANDVKVHENATRVTSVDGGKELDVRQQVYDETRLFYTIILDEGLEAGQEYDVYLTYVGQLRDDMNGFYRSYYYADGAKRWLAVTQFESTGARRAFPCFDEPSLKANISLSIERPSTYTSVSNMELYNTTDVVGEKDLQKDTFRQTPPMSTYLLAFLVSDFAKTSDAGGKVSLWHPNSSSSQATYALNVSQSLLEFMEEFTGIPFALPKMDQVAIPDFSAGAMENWGLVTYRDRVILFDEAVSTTADRQNIATTIAHEFSHQWFGDLVSPDWWSFTWLNEGFATYFELFATAAVERGWRLEDQFIIRKVQPSLASDAYAATHAITSNVYTPAEIEAVFDYVSYGKAGSVLRMASHFLTKEVFQKGLRSYLTARSYSTGRPEYLFSALQEAADGAGRILNVTTIMNSWTLQEGYPLITVIRNYSTNSTAVSQKRFLLVKDNSTSDAEETNWWVPLTYTTKSANNFDNTTDTIWLQNSMTQINDVAKSDDWIIFNLQETGFYRVNYDAANWQLLGAQLNSEQYAKIHVVNRAQLLDDAFNLARAGDLDYSVALSLARYLVRETDYVPWYSAFTAFNYLNVRLAGMAQQQYAVYKEFVLGLSTHLYSKLGFEPKATDDHLTRLLRTDVLSWACKLEMADCVKTAIDMFNKKMTNSTSVVIPADVSSTVYCTALRHGGEKEWKFLKNIYDKSNVATEQVLIISALGCSANESIINNYLSLSISEDSGIRKQDAASVFSAVYANPAGVDIAFKFLTNNYDKISQFYGGMGSIGSILTGIADRLSTQDQLDNLKQFVADNKAKLGRALSASTQAVETAQGNRRWLDERGGVIASWLQAWKTEQQSAASTTPTSTTPSSSTSTTPATIILLLVAAACAMLLF